MIKCPKCKSSNPEKTFFCKTCQYPIPQNSEIIRCENGHIMDPLWNYCPFCKVKKTSGDVNSDNIVVDKDDTKGEDKIQEKTIIKSKEKAIISSNKIVAFVITFSTDPDGQFFPIREGRQVIGCSQEANICIANSIEMYDRHAIILHRNGKFFIGKYLSHCAISVNGKDALKKTQLNNFDIITLGNTEFRFIMAFPPNLKKNQKNNG